MAEDAQNNPFIKNLASSDNQTRDQALDSLRAFLSSRSEISELDLLKLWKGLFYCTSCVVGSMRYAVPFWLRIDPFDQCP